MSDPYNPGPPFRANSGYGRRRDPITGKDGKFHSGQDYAAPSGTPIPAAAPGEVVYSGFNDNFGNTVIVKNAAGYSLYAHMQDGSPMPNLGQRIWPGDVIGNVGSTGARTTGPHLHYSVIKNEYATNALAKDHPNGGPLGLLLKPDNTIDPARYDTSVPYLTQAAVTGAGSITTPSAPLNGLGLPSQGRLSGRFGAWTSLQDQSTGASIASAPRPGGLPGMIADYLRESRGGAQSSQAIGGPAAVPAVPFSPATDPWSQGQPVGFGERFGDWPAIRRLTSSRDTAR